MAEKIIGIYKITNTVTGDFYIGSSNDVKRRWAEHKCKSKWNEHPNNPMYQDMQKYGLDKFSFEILEEVEEEKLKEIEQKFIETLNPTYNSNRANGRDIERYKEQSKQYYESHKEEKKQYYESHKEEILEQKKQYNNQLCSYNGEKLTLCALVSRFIKAGIPHPTLEAKKYLVH